MEKMEGVRVRWEQAAGPLSRNPSLSILRGSGGTHAHSLPFSKVRQRKSPRPHPPSARTELCSSSSDFPQELLQAGTDQRDLAGKGVREAGAGEGPWEKASVHQCRQKEGPASTVQMSSGAPPSLGWCAEGTCSHWPPDPLLPSSSAPLPSDPPVTHSPPSSDP